MLTAYSPDVKIALFETARELVPAGGTRFERRVRGRTLQASLHDFLKWYRQHGDLVAGLEAIPDGRDQSKTRIPLSAILLAVMCMFWLGLGSLRALDDRLKVSPGLRRLLLLAGWEGSISDDTFADALNKLDLFALRAVLHRQAKREFKRWGAGRYLQSELGQRLKGTGAAHLAAKAVVAIDGHELFYSEHRACAQCLTRTIKEKRGGDWVELEQRYHKVVVAQWVGGHPSIMLDVEPLLPGEGEQTAAYRLVERLAKVYGASIGTLVADALYDGEPFRRVARQAAYRTVIRIKKFNQDPGRAAKRALDRRDPNRTNPDRKYRETHARRYECWGVPEGDRQFIEVRRTDGSGEGARVQQAYLLTDWPVTKAPMVAIAMLYETRWWIENTGFHELAGAWSLDRAFVHAGRPTAAMAIVTLALMAYNAFQVYVYRHLGLDPSRPCRTLGDFRRDFLETLSLPQRRAHARAP